MGENTPIQRQMNTKSIIFDNKIFLLKNNNKKIILKINIIKLNINN